MAISRVFALALGLFGAAACSQLPEFAQQYRQRLGGAVDELGRVVSRFDESAQASGLSREDAIQRFAGQPDALVRRQGESMSQIIERFGRLRRQRDDFVSSGPFTRVAVLLGEMDPALARSTYLDFEPALPVTTEGVVAGAVGFVGVWGGLLVFMRFLGRAVGPSRRARPGASGSVGV